MKMKSTLLNYVIALGITIPNTSCNTQTMRNTSISEQTNVVNTTTPESSEQIAEYVVATFEDSNGNLWFGTLAKGVARYDGKHLRYFTINDGLPSNRIVCIIEDTFGNLWFGTGDGISMFDGTNFTNFSNKNGLADAMVSNLFIDSRGIFWVGTWGGVFKFDGTTFTEFKLPIPTITTKPNEDTKNWITAIMEDTKGNIWFGRDGYGACKYDGKTFQHFLKKDGLYSNNIQEISEAGNGNIWFGSRVAEKDNPDENKRFGKGGITIYDGNTFSHFPEIAGINNNDVYEIYRDTDHNIWIGTIGNGVYKYNGNEFVNYFVPKSVMSITKDKKGTIWLGCAGGLYCIKSSGVVNVTQDYLIKGY